MTLQIHVGDVDEARAFYTTLFGRQPDFAPHADFLEWQVLSATELWWQVVGKPNDLQPLRTRVRFLVDDVASAAQWARAALGVQPAPITTLPDVVAFTDFDDPWGNRIGYYHDILPSGQQPEPGGSVHDESLYDTDPQSP